MHLSVSTRPSLWWLRLLASTPRNNKLGRFLLRLMMYCALSDAAAATVSSELGAQCFAICLAFEGSRRLFAQGGIPYKARSRSERRSLAVHSYVKRCRANSITPDLGGHFGPNLKNLTLDDLDLSEVVLTNVNLSGTVFSNVNLANARFNNVLAYKTKWHKVNLHSASICNSKANASEWDDCDLRFSNWQQVSLQKAQLAICRFADAALQQVDLTSATVDSCQFTNTNFVKCILNWSVLINSPLQTQLLDNTNLLGTHERWSGTGLYFAGFQRWKFAAVNQ